MQPFIRSCANVVYVLIIENMISIILILKLLIDIPNLEQETIASFADDTGVLAVGKDHKVAADKLQVSIEKINTCSKTWHIKLNENKSMHVFM